MTADNGDSMLAAPGMDEQEVKLGALLLWALMATADEDLDKFRRQRLGRKSSVELEHLGRVRDMLRGLLTAIRKDDEHLWQRVTDAASMLALQDADGDADSDADSEVAEDDEAEPRPSQAAGASGSDAGDGEPTSAPVKPAPADAVVEPPSKPLPGLGDPRDSPWVKGSKPTGPAIAPRPRRPDETITDFVHLLPKREPLPFEAANEQSGEADLDEPEPDTVRLREHVLPFHQRHRPARVERPRKVTEDVACYADFCAERHVCPDRLDELMGEYQLADDEACLELDAHWNERFASDPDLLERWDQRFEQRRAELVASEDE